jgi:hypothetical protein
MDRHNVKERLKRLHEELLAHQDNPTTRERLRGVLPEDGRVVHGEAADATLPKRLEAVAVQFEADHPKVAGSLRQLLNLLNEVGI